MPSKIDEEPILSDYLLKVNFSQIWMKNLYNKGRGMFVRDVRLTLQNRIAEFMITQVASRLNDGPNT